MSSLFNHVKSQVSILELINQYTSLKPAGVYYKGICPFHTEKTPSFTVSPHKEIFYCFGCHATGDVISFIAKIENISQLDAAKHLVDSYNINVPEEIDKEFKAIETNKNEKEKYFLICQLVSDWCNKNLFENKIAFKYISNRGFSKESIEKYKIGYFGSIKELLKYCSKNGLLARDLIDANILHENKTLYSPFEDRIIFPIKDLMGRYCGFGGRVFKDDDQRAKYYNSQEHSYFNKGSLLFGLDLAKKYIQERNYAFLVEGYTDCIAMSQYNYQNCVATLGTACTLEHLKLLGRYTQQIYVLYDGDEAGQKAILRLTEMCWNVNLEVRVVSLGDKEDPASFLQNNGNLQHLIHNAKDIYSFFIDISSKNFNIDTLQEKIWTVKKLIDIIRNIDDQLKRDILLQDIAVKLNVPLESLKKNIAIEKVKIKKDIKAEAKLEPQITDLEKKLFSIIMNNLELFTPKFYYLSNFFASPAKEILKQVIILNKNERYSINNLFEVIDENQKVFASKMLIEYDYTFKKDFTNLIIQFQRKNWKKITESIKQKLINAQNHSDKQVALDILSEFNNLKKQLVHGGCND